MSGARTSTVPEVADTVDAVARLASLPGLTTASEVAADVAGASATGKLLPVVPELEAVLPLRGLRRGSTVSVTGARSVLLALLARATAAGSWAAVVGIPDVGLAAAAELGVELCRTALVPRPGPDVVRVAAALLDGVDIVVVPGGTSMAAASARRLTARVRHRGGVLVAEGRWPGADVELVCTPGSWDGVDEFGRGYLSARTMRIQGRGKSSARVLETTVLLAGPSGGVEAGEHARRLEVAS